MNPSKKIAWEIKDMRENAPAYCSAAPASDWDLMNWQATIEGPPGTPYEGGKFHLGLSLPFDYPQSPPRVTVETDIYTTRI